MIANKTCPKCGGTLSSDALNGLCPKCLGRLGFSAPADGDAGGLLRLGDYELLEEIARGGMGVVYRARQLSLNRIVAVKVVLHGPFSSPEFTRRFRTEAEAAAALRHPNIVSIHEIGEHDGRQFLSMEYIEGHNFAELVREKPLPARRAAGYLKIIAEAVQHAHQRGILHRDLKPSNVLLDTFDQPHVTDFGLAKLPGRDVGLTTTGQVLGSPNHMPPEQAAGKFAEATPAADVYSLGAIFYQLLTGRPPFQGESLQDILLQVQTAEPIAPRRLNPSVPADLQTICLKCLQKEPARRYLSAQALAEDLSRFLANEPIQARPVMLPERVRLWCRRRPVLAGLLLAWIAAVLFGLVGILWQWRRAELHALGEAHQRIAAENNAAKIRLNLYAADISLASQAIQRGDFGLARRTLDGLRPQAGESDLRGFEWGYLRNLCRGEELATFTGHDWIVTCAAFSPDGRRVATGSQDGTVRVWDVAVRKPVTLLLVASNAVWSTAFTPDNRWLMTADSDGNVKFWNVDTCQIVKRFSGRIAALSKTGTIVATADSSPFSWEPAGKVAVWNYRTGEKLREFDAPGRALALSADGSKLAVAAVSTGIDLWDVPSGQRLRSLPTEKPVWSLNFSPDGSRLVSAGWSSDVLIWDLSQNRPSEKLRGHRLTVWSAIFSPDGATLLTTGSDQTIRFWDAVTLQPGMILHGHENEVWCAAFSSDGQMLATGGKDRKVMLWSTKPRVVPDRLPNLNDTRPIFSPDGTRLITMDSAMYPANRSVLWDLNDRERPMDQSEDAVLGFSIDGSSVITWDAQQSHLRVRSWRDHTEKQIALAGIDSQTGPFGLCGFSPAQDIFFAIDGNGLIRFWEVGDGKLLESFAGPHPPIRVAVLGPAGKFLAIGMEQENSVRLYERATGKMRTLSRHNDFVCGLAFSPDDGTLASGSVDGTIRLWDTATGGQLAVLPGHMEEATDVAFSPDGRTLASVSHTESVKLWHLATRRELISLDFPLAGRFLQFSPDGRHLAVTADDNSVRLFDAPSIVQLDGTAFPR